MIDPSHYAYRVRWSAEDRQYVATVAEFPSLSWLADSPHEAIDGMLQLASEVVGEMDVAGESVPEPIATRRYSGEFVVRTTPEAHRELALDAAEQDVSLNRLAVARLSRV